MKRNCIRLCKPGFTKSHRTLGNIVDLRNGGAYNFVKLDLQNLILLRENDLYV